jgi:hypothetical protein
MAALPLRHSEIRLPTLHHGQTFWTRNLRHTVLAYAFLNTRWPGWGNFYFS